jgi:hypothetical protein
MYHSTSRFFFVTDASFLALEMAIPLWKLLLSNRFPLLEKWCHFLQVGETRSYGGYRAIDVQ